MSAATTPHPATVFDVDVDPEFKAMLDFLQANAPDSLGPRPHLDDPVQLRQDYRNSIDSLTRPLFAELENKVDLQEIVIPGSTRSVKARVYTRKADANEPAKALLLWLHNGGGVEGDLDCEHLIALHHCIRTGQRIVYPNYSKAPEHKYPAGLDDCHEALHWMSSRPDTLKVQKGAPISIWGSSQGATFAASLAVREAKAGRGNNIKKIIWSHGVGDVALIGETKSWKATNGRYNILAADQMRAYLKYYLDDSSQESNPEVAPLQIKKTPADTPPFHFIRCSLDPLDGDAELYEEKLKQAGISTSQTQLGALPHVYYIVGSFFPKAIERLLDDLEKQLA